MDELEETAKIPIIRVTLYGPSETGKTLFIYKALQKKHQDLAVTTKIETMAAIRTFYQFREGKKYPIETYRLILIDTPGKKEYSKERIRGFSGAVGVLVFYDSTNPTSVDELKLMLQNEILESEFFPNIIGIVLIGTKKDQGINKDAVLKAQEIKELLTSKVKPVYRYEVPHILINVNDIKEVAITLYILESILIVFQPPKRMVSLLSAENFLGIKKVSEPQEEKIKEFQKGTPQVEIPIESRAVEIKGEQPKVVEEEPKRIIATHPVEVKSKQVHPPHVAEEDVKLKPLPKMVEKEEKVEFSLIDNKKIWNAISKIVRTFSEANFGLFIRKKENVYEVAYYPGEPKLEAIPWKISNLFKEIIMNIENLMTNLKNGKIVEKSLIKVKGEKGNLLIIRRKTGWLLVNVSNKPSKELEDFLTR